MECFQKQKLSTFEQPGMILCSAQVLSKYSREIRGGFYNNMRREKMQNKREGVTNSTRMP
jgi:hypothetical protein